MGHFSKDSEIKKLVKKQIYDKLASGGIMAQKSIRPMWADLERAKEMQHA